MPSERGVCGTVMAKGMNCGSVEETQASTKFKSQKADQVTFFTFFSAQIAGERSK